MLEIPLTSCQFGNLEDKEARILMTRHEEMCMLRTIRTPGTQLKSNRRDVILSKETG